MHASGTYSTLHVTTRLEIYDEFGLAKIFAVFDHLHVQRVVRVRGGITGRGEQGARFASKWTDCKEGFCFLLYPSLRMHQVPTLPYT